MGVPVVQVLAVAPQTPLALQDGLASEQAAVAPPNVPAQFQVRLAPQVRPLSPFGVPVVQVLAVAPQTPVTGTPHPREICISSALSITGNPPNS